MTRVHLRIGALGLGVLVLAGAAVATDVFVGPGVLRSLLGFEEEPVRPILVTPRRIEAPSPMSRALAEGEAKATTPNASTPTVLGPQQVYGNPNDYESRVLLEGSEHIPAKFVPPSISPEDELAMREAELREQNKNATTLDGNALGIRELGAGGYGGGGGGNGGYLANVNIPEIGGFAGGGGGGGGYGIAQSANNGAGASGGGYYGGGGGGGDDGSSSARSSSGSSAGLSAVGDPSAGTGIYAPGAGAGPNTGNGDSVYNPSMGGGDGAYLGAIQINGLTTFTNQGAYGHWNNDLYTSITEATTLVNNVPQSQKTTQFVYKLFLGTNFDTTLDFAGGLSDGVWRFNGLIGHGATDKNLIFNALGDRKMVLAGKYNAWYSNVLITPDTEVVIASV
jgi:hypothetical protein